MKKSLILIVILNFICFYELYTQNLITLSGGLLFPVNAYSGGDLKYAMFGSFYDGYAFKKMGYDLNLKYKTGSSFRFFVKIDYDYASNDYSQIFHNVTGLTTFKSKSEITGWGLGVEFLFLDIFIKTPYKLKPYIFLGYDIDNINFSYSADNPPPGALSQFHIDPSYRLCRNLGLGIDYIISQEFLLNLEFVYSNFNFIGAGSKSPAFHNLNSRYLNDDADSDIPNDPGRQINGYKFTLGFGYSF